MSAEPLTKCDLVVEDLRRRIIGGELPRGARLRQDEIAARLSISITPIREALRILEMEGLVVSEPHKGARVNGLDVEKTKADYIVRRLVETYALKRATLRVSALDISHAWKLLDDMKHATEARDAGRFRELNREFHFLFYDRCGQDALTGKIASMWRSFPWDLSLDSLRRTEDSLEEHIQILNAVELGDPEKVGIATESHMANGFAYILERMDEGKQDPFAIDSK